MALCSQKRIQHTKLQPPGNNAINNAIVILKPLKTQRFKIICFGFESRPLRQKDPDQTVRVFLAQEARIRRIAIIHRCSSRHADFPKNISKLPAAACRSSARTFSRIPTFHRAKETAVGSKVRAFLAQEARIRDCRYSFTFSGPSAPGGRGRGRSGKPRGAV